MLEPLTTLSFLAGMTTRIRFTNSILLAALRRPVVLAKAAATLDVLSGGRLDLGVGVGWQREEYEAAGLDFDARGRLLDHTLEVCQTLWREQRATLRSPRTLSFDGIHHDAQARAGRRRPDLGQRHRQRRGAPAPGPLRHRLDPVGQGIGRRVELIDTIPRMRDAVAEFGRDPLDLGIAGKLANVTGKDGRPDVGATIDRLPALVEADRRPAAASGTTT